MIARQLIERAQPPAPLAHLEARLLERACRTAAAQVGLELPRATRDAESTNASDDALSRFRKTTLALAAATSGQPALRAQLARALGTQAERLGRLARRTLHASDADAFALLRYLYQGIGICIEGSLPGELCFRSCSFASAYDPDTCNLMSAMDEGVMRGLAGNGTLFFHERITEGCEHCRACFLERSTHD